MSLRGGRVQRQVPLIIFTFLPPPIPLSAGDLFPTGAIRLIAAVEALNEFVLIGWSASFTHLSMQKSWDRAQSQLAAR